MNNRKSQIKNRKSRGFTLLELLVVIGIIALLAALLFPVLSSVRASARETDTRNLLTILDQAADRYFADYRSYPGPISDTVLLGTDRTMGLTMANVTSEGWSGELLPTGVPNSRVTSTENFVLGLTGGLVSGSGGAINYDPRQVGQGPATLTAQRTARQTAYFSNPQALSFSDSSSGRTGKYSDEAGEVTPAIDSAIPEFVDRFPDSMPILYVRARRGLDVASGTVNDQNNNVIVNLTGNNAANARVGAYNINHLTPYTASSIGTGREIDPQLTGNGGVYAGYTGDVSLTPHGIRTINAAEVSLDRSVRFPFGAYAYFVDRSTIDSGTNNALNDRARNADRFILISAGRDRIFGTEDDITNFGRVGQ